MVIERAGFRGKMIKSGVELDRYQHVRYYQGIMLWIIECERANKKRIRFGSAD